MLGPQAYASHENWHQTTSNGIMNGHAKKGVFAPRERPMFTADHMHVTKRRNIPPPNAYIIPTEEKYLLGVSSRCEKGSYHTDEAII